MIHKILVADDQLDAARLLASLLKLDGYETEYLEGNWTDLVGEVERRRPDLVILDVHLPGVDGLELLRQLRACQNPDVARVPVLLVSALDHRYEGGLAGMNGFLFKPYTRQALHEAMQKIEIEGVSA